MQPQIKISLEACYKRVITPLVPVSHLTKSKWCYVLVTDLTLGKL